MSLERLRACVVAGRTGDLARVPEVDYLGVVDVATGSGSDSMTLCIVHAEEESGRLIAVVDAVREARPPFDPEEVTADCAALLEGYGLRVVHGDRFAGGWTVLHPLPFDGRTWSLAAALSVYAGYLFTALGLLIVCVAILRGTTAAYGGLGGALALRYLFAPRRGPPARLPRPAELIATVIAIDGLVAALAGLVYLVPLFAQAAGIVPSIVVTSSSADDVSISPRFDSTRWMHAPAQSDGAESENR